ncbi:hypothetical protein P7C73_g4998, partial [Tremellales sp. Uapishka_1]
MTMPRSPTAPPPLRSPPSSHSTLPFRPSPLSSTSASRSVSTPLNGMGHGLHNTLGVSSGSKGKGKALGIKEKLKDEASGVVKRRAGSVLARGFILKTDHYPSGRALDLDLNIQGAPNFRAPTEEGLNVFGVAQPTLPGLKSILTILGCQPEMPSPLRRSSIGKPGYPLEKTTSNPLSGAKTPESDKGQAEANCIWFSTREETLIYCNGRPYVLRDASTPFAPLTLSDRPSNLEDIESRLKDDILAEARRYGGLILTHDEISSGETMPTWVSVDEDSIRTPKEVYQDIKAQNWRVEYYRIPVAPDRPIEDNYLDAYVSRLRDVDPFSTSLVFNCGMGVVRTTFAMVAALLVRRKQYLLRGLDDPFPSAPGASGIATPAAGPSAALFLEQATHLQSLNKSLLKLTRVLDRNLSSKRPGAAIDLLASEPTILDQLRKAHMGNYQIVLSLLSSLDNGREMKRLVDRVIDACDAVVNLRENVIEHRIKYSMAAMDDKARQTSLDRAIRSLEQYFDLIVFSSYVEEEQGGNTGVSFSTWLKARPEIWNQIKVMRRQFGNRLFVFAPANDLSVISRLADAADSTPTRGNSVREVDLQGGKVLGDEWAEHVVTNRNGIMLRASTLLKSDLWLMDSAASTDGVRGAVGFKQISGSAVYTTGQPTQDAISHILNIVQERSTNIRSIVWVCLREEPLVMINGSPYCLRRDSTALRNMRDYTGVSSSRLEVLEERLKSDVVSELSTFQGRILLHTETKDGHVAPVWESVDRNQVESIRDVMEDLKNARDDGPALEFFRIPITSESSPDFHDISDIMDLCMSTDLENSAIILNDQLGRGRSSTAAVIVLLIQRWMRKSRQEAQMPRTPKLRPMNKRSTADGGYRSSWQIINSVLRVIRNGLDVKRVVDNVIDMSSTHFNVRDAIEDLRVKAEESTDHAQKTDYTAKAMYHLRRYYHLMLFQAYLDDRSPDEENPYSFESFIKHRPVFKTLEKELREGGLASLKPIERMEPADGMALPDEVTQVVVSRSGVILSAQTILKSDFFSGLQKLSLPERVEGAANYRRLPMVISDLEEAPEAGSKEDHYIYGTGMPSASGLRNALKKMEAGPHGARQVMWTSLREEPVLYVKSRPHVLRLVDKPLTNVVTTGVTAAVVERMEVQLKHDVLKEIRAGEGRLLLHDEVEIKPGQYEIIPIWETVDEYDVMTPKELYESVIKEGYQVDYVRVAITDEQAPLPKALQDVVSRVARGLDEEKDLVFNCQMGRGRTTTGMVAAALISTITLEDMSIEPSVEDDDNEMEDGHEAGQYLNGEYKTILQLVTVMSHGKQAKRITDKACNLMEGVQNLRKAVYDFKVKIDACEPGSSKHSGLVHLGVNYLYRYGTLIVLANFLLETKEKGIPLSQTDFPSWMAQHREIRTVLSRKTLD